MHQLGSFYNRVVHPAVRVLETACQLYPNKVVLSYNGGKDCTVLLELIERFNFDIPVVYFKETDAFPELNQFVESRLRKTNLKTLEMGSDIKKEMQTLVDMGYEAVILGQRSSDPQCPSGFFAESTPNWPKFIRVFPLLNWSYTDIWKFIKETDSEYCILYEKGYSSIGPMSKTLPNPLLNGRPAWELFDSSSERKGRDPKL